MTKQPQPKKDWVAIINNAIEEDEEYRLARAFNEGRQSALTYFEHFFLSLEEKARRGERVDPKAFEKEVQAYPTKIAAPIIAQIMMNATLDKNAVRMLAQKQLEQGIQRINRTHARTIEIMETHIYKTFQDIIDEQEARIARLSELENEQDVNFMRAITIWEQYENLAYQRTWSPAQQFRNIRNMFRRRTLEREAMEAMRAYKENQNQDKRSTLAAEIKTAHEQSTRELQELKEAFNVAKEKIAQLDTCQLNVFNSRLKREVDNRTHRTLLARFEILYAPKKNPEP
jgi:hypothetical protein